MKNKKLFKMAQEGAEKVFMVSIDEQEPFEESLKKVIEQTGYKNILASSITGGLRAVGWRSCLVDGVKTLFIHDSIKQEKPKPYLSKTLNKNVTIPED